MTDLAAATPTLASAALAAAKATLLLAGAAMAAGALRRASAAARHLVWALALAGVAALPVLGGLVPAWRLSALAFLAPAPEAGLAWSPDAVSAQAPQISLRLLLFAAWAAGTLVVLGRLALGLRAA